MDTIKQPPAFSPCCESCNHSQTEHDAFDAGLKAAEETPLDENPHRGGESNPLWVAWESGYSVGTLNREHSTR